MHLAQGFPLVPVTAAGRTWPFLLDTGAQDWMVAPWAAEAMGLAPDPGRRTRVFGTDSVTDAPNVLLAGTSLGGLALPTRSVPAATLPGFEQVSPTPAGILGAPTLAQYDILLDGPAQQVVLYAVEGCQAVPVPFVPPLARVPLRRLPGGEVLVPITLGGHQLEALLDTGARGTVIAASVPGAAAARGLRVGEDRMPDLRPTVVPLALERGEALLGMDYFAARRAWISYASGLLLIELPRLAPAAGYGRR